MQSRSGNLVLALGLMVGCGLAWAAEVSPPPLRVRTGGGMSPDIRVGLARFVEVTGQAAVVDPVPGAAAKGLATNPELIDVFVACTRGMADLAKAGLVAEEAGKPIFYQRAAIILPATNPSGIWALGDLRKDGLRLGLSEAVASRFPHLAQQLDGRQAASVPTDEAGLIEALDNGKLDAAVTFDTAGRLGRGHAVVRLSANACADDTGVRAICMAPALGSKRAAVAADLVAFCAENHDAKVCWLQQGLLTDDGTWVKTYGADMMNAYLSVARQIAEDYAPNRKDLLDLSCGPGQLTIEIAKAAPGLQVTGLDIEPEAIDLARDLAQASPAAERLRFVCADVHELPFADASFDIVVSRGSIYFWRDHTRALQEVMRVLRPDGVAFIGGGSGKYLTMDEFAKQRKGGHAPIGRPKTQRRSRVVIPLPNGKVAEASVSVDLSVSDWAFPFPVASYDAEMTRAGIADYRVLSEGGQWVEFRKPAPQP